MTYLTSDSQFAAADFEMNRLIALRAAAADDAEKARLSALIAQPLGDLLRSVPPSTRSAAAVLRALTNPAVLTLDADVAAALRRVEGLLSAPFTAV